MPGEAADHRMTLQEAADALGVHYMTAYRYVRTGRLPAMKLGSEWRVDPADVEALRRPTVGLGSTSAVARPDAADDARPSDGGRTGPGGRRGTPYHRRLEARLIAGDEPGAWAVLEDAMTAGIDPGQLYLSVLGPAMASIGDRWETGQVSVAEEHRASVVMLRIIGRLGPRFARRGRKRGSVVVGAAPGDHHGVPVALAADLLRGRGFTVVDLGGDTPAESFVDAARAAERLIAVGINATNSGNEAAIAEAITAVKRAVRCPVVLGGQGIADVTEGLALGADVVTLSAPELVAAFEALAEGDAQPEQAPA